MQGALEGRLGGAKIARLAQRARQAQLGRRQSRRELQHAAELVLGAVQIAELLQIDLAQRAARQHLRLATLRGRLAQPAHGLLRIGGAQLEGRASNVVNGFHVWVAKIGCSILQRDVRLAALIPARYNAQRLPGKPLADIGGAPMVVRVAQAASKAEGIDEVAVATDDERIASAVKQAGFRAVLTDPACRNGTERIAQAAHEVPAEGYLNVQGDEPLIDPRAIAALGKLVRAGAEMATLARPLLPDEEALPSVVKVVLDSRGRALYFSRSLIPYPRTKSEVVPLAHIGLY